MSEERERSSNTINPPPSTVSIVLARRFGVKASKSLNGKEQIWSQKSTKENQTLIFNLYFANNLNSNWGFQGVPVIYTCRKCYREFSPNVWISNELLVWFQEKVTKGQPSQDPTLPSAITSSLAWHVFSYDYMGKGTNGINHKAFGLRKALDTKNKIKKKKKGNDFQQQLIASSEKVDRHISEIHLNHIELSFVN